MSSRRVGIPVRGDTTLRYDHHLRAYDERHPHRPLKYRPHGYRGGDIMRRQPLGVPSRSIDHHPFSKTEFSNSLKQLHTTLQDSIRFFQEFEDSYLAETDAIKPYATPQIMDELWVAKAKNSDRNPARTPQGSPVDSSNSRRRIDGPGRPHLPPTRGKFRDHIQYIKDDFETALNCGPSTSHRKQRHRERASSLGNADNEASARLDAESTERLMEKLAGQYTVLGTILSNIYKVRSYVQEFIKESELLASYLDNSRNLWQVEEPMQPRRQRNLKHGYESDYLDHDDPDSARGDSSTEHGDWGS